VTAREYWHGKGGKWGVLQIDPAEKIADRGGSARSRREGIFGTELNLFPKMGKGPFRGGITFSPTW